MVLNTELARLDRQHQMHALDSARRLHCIDVDGRDGCRERGVGCEHGGGGKDRGRGASMGGGHENLFYGMVAAG